MSVYVLGMSAGYECLLTPLSWKQSQVALGVERLGFNCGGWSQLEQLPFPYNKPKQLSVVEYGL